MSRREIELTWGNLLHLVEVTEMSYVELECMRLNARRNDETVFVIVETRFEKRPQDAQSRRP